MCPVCLTLWLGTTRLPLALFEALVNMLFDGLLLVADWLPVCLTVRFGNIAFFWIGWFERCVASCLLLNRTDTCTVVFVGGADTSEGLLILWKPCIPYSWTGWTSLLRLFLLLPRLKWCCRWYCPCEVDLLLGLLFSAYLLFNAASLRPFYIYGDGCIIILVWGI